MSDEPQVDRESLAGAGTTRRDDGPLPPSIADYRILGRLGAGGMGVVYEAEQASPRRRVALKVLRRGVGGDALGVRLFRREAAALARLRHPAIATIYESGQTEHGEHFFAMELVRGESMDDWLERLHADGAPAGRRQRDVLQVVQAIGEAVTYAHQRGVIHRDLKPSNVVVQAAAREESRTSATPLVKVLDFGLARITDADIELATTRTEVGILHGTLPYMSPEQVRGDPGEVDTRTDVYSLGVILYRALTGRLPYAATGVSLPEAMRAIVEDRPRPFDRGEGVGVDRDLQTIVLKALEKEPDRRYRSVEALSEDLGRYLADLPILARPPSALYLLRKLVARHRALFALGAALLLLLVAFAATMAIQAGRIARERDRANLEARTSRRVTEFLEGLFEVSDPSAARGSTVTARELLQEGAERVEGELAGEPAVQSRLLRTLAAVHSSLGLYDEAEALYRDALDRAREGPGARSVEAAAALTGLGDLHRVQDRPDEAEARLREALALRRDLLGEGHADTAQALNNLALTLERQDRFEEAEALQREALAIRRRVFGAESAEAANSLHNLSIILAGRGELDAAIDLAREALEIRIRLFGEDHLWVASTAGTLGNTLATAARYEEAEVHLRQALEVRRRLQGRAHPDVAITAGNLASLLHDQGRWSDAEAAYREALAIAETSVGELHSSYVFALNNLASLLEDRGDREAAEPLFRRSLALRLELFGEGSSAVTRARHNLARLLVRLGRREEAEPLAEAVLATYRAELGEEHRDVGKALGNLGSLRLAQGRVAEAIDLAGRALAVARGAWEADHPALAGPLRDVAAARAAAGDWHAAAAALEEAHRILTARLPPGHSRLAEVKGELAEVRAATGDGPAAAALADESLELFRRTLGDEHPWTREAAARSARLR